MKKPITRALLLLAATALVGGCDLSEVLPGDVANSVRAFNTDDCSGTPPAGYDIVVSRLYPELGAQFQGVHAWESVPQTDFPVHEVEVLEGSLEVWSEANFQGDRACIPEGS